MKGDGRGETIALIVMDHDPNLASDLHTFDQEYGLRDPTLDVIDQAGTQTDPGWSLEESLDVEWAHAIAPGAGILVVEAAPGDSDTQAFEDLMAAVATASRTPGVAVVSMSWGYDEFAGETQYDSSFTTRGITYIAASGDRPGVEYPAASPDVLAVGGTTMNQSASGGYGSETAWSDSGGGYSAFEAEPAYQQTVQTTGQRSVPDVAFDGDPNTGVSVYCTPATSDESGSASASQGTWQMVGGTSLGAPAWAGIIAIVDQGRNLAGLSNLSGATQTLPSLYRLSASDFHPIAASTQTGLGTPVGPALIDDLVASTITSPLPNPTPTPSPTPNPTPTATPTSPAGKHHRREPPHRPTRARSRAAAPTVTLTGSRNRWPDRRIAPAINDLRGFTPSARRYGFR